MTTLLDVWWAILVYLGGIFIIGSGYTIYLVKANKILIDEIGNLNFVLFVTHAVCWPFILPLYLIGGSIIFVLILPCLGYSLVKLLLNKRKLL